MDYPTLDRLLQGRCRESRKLANNTYAIRDGAALHIRFHQTNILTFYTDGSVQVKTGGRRTVTTKTRINLFLPAGMSIFQRDGTWWVKPRWYAKCIWPWQNRADEEFREGWIITPEEVACAMLREGA